MSGSKAIIEAGVTIIAAGFFGWFVGVAFSWIFQNATGGYANATMQTLGANAPLILTALGFLGGTLYALKSLGGGK